MKKIYRVFLDNKLLSAIFGILLLLCIIFVLRLLIKNFSSKGVFAKGTLIMNTDKSSYLPGEKMNISILSLDNAGKNICNSTLKLEITNPQNLVTKIDVALSPTCNDNGITNDADYLASHILGESGEYKLKLTNFDTNGAIETKIKVDQNLSFNVKRSGATRLGISKPNRYPMIITVKAGQDFKGQIKDSVPEDIKIVWQGSAKIEGKQIIWDVDLKAGQENTFSYEYEAIQTKNGIYKFGPISIDGQNVGGVWQAVSAK